jgi:hypothetical protein
VHDRLWEIQRWNGGRVAYVRDPNRQNDEPVTRPLQAA